MDVEGRSVDVWSGRMSVWTIPIKTQPRQGKQIVARPKLGFFSRPSPKNYRLKNLFADFWGRSPFDV